MRDGAAVPLWILFQTNWDPPHREVGQIHHWNVSAQRHLPLLRVLAPINTGNVGFLLAWTLGNLRSLSVLPDKIVRL